jgi:hypothetical protein
MDVAQELTGGGGGGVGGGGVGGGWGGRQRSILGGDDGPKTLPNVHTFSLYFILLFRLEPNKSYSAIDNVHEQLFFKSFIQRTF